MTPPALLDLTRTELKILANVAQGKDNKDICKEFNITPKTVSAHRYNLNCKLRKIGIRGIAEMTHYAIGLGLVKIIKFPREQPLDESSN